MIALQEKNNKPDLSEFKWIDKHIKFLPKDSCAL
jgi:hypothetical protein